MELRKQNTGGTGNSNVTGGNLQSNHGSTQISGSYNPNSSREIGQQIHVTQVGQRKRSEGAQFGINSTTLTPK